MRYPRFAVIPSNGRGCLWQCVEAISPQVDQIYVVFTGPSELLLTKGDPLPSNVFVTPYRGDLNISKWWNVGLETVAFAAQYQLSPKYDVAVLNDDVIVPEGWFDAVAGTMRQMQCAAGCSGGYGMSVLHTQDVAPSVQTRMQGFAFILAGELGLRADEQFVWYCGDDDLGRRAATSGGMVMVPGFHVNHLYPNGQMNFEIAAAIPKDMQRYVDKHGGRPW